MKSKLFIAFAAIGMFAITSCEKCEDCTVTNLMGSDYTEEFCDEDLDAAKENPLINC